MTRQRTFKIRVLSTFVFFIAVLTVVIAFGVHRITASLTPGQ